VGDRQQRQGDGGYVEFRYRRLFDDTPSRLEIRPSLGLVGWWSCQLVAWSAGTMEPSCNPARISSI
jgi:hypothetical protein